MRLLFIDGAGWVTFCRRCDCEIDLTVCWCGDPTNGHRYSDPPHSPVPMGCMCHVAKEER